MRRSIFSLIMVALLSSQAWAQQGLTSSSGGLEGGIELTLLRLYANHGVGEAAGGNSFFNSSSDTVASGRYWIGYEGAGGNGVRARYFGYDSSLDAPGEAFDVKLVDFEAVTSLNVSAFEFEAFGGLRWGEIEWTHQSGDGVTSSLGFEGTGFTLGFDVARPVFGNVSLIGGARQSFLYGETKDLNSTGRSLGVAVSIAEFRLGAQWAQPLANGGSFIVRGAWEHQIYNSLSANVDNGFDPEDVDASLSGPMLSVSIER